MDLPTTTTEEPEQVADQLPEEVVEDVSEAVAATRRRAVGAEQREGWAAARDGHHERERRQAAGDAV